MPRNRLPIGVKGAVLTINRSLPVYPDQTDMPGEVGMSQRVPKGDMTLPKTVQPYGYAPAPDVRLLDASLNTVGNIPQGAFAITH
jgi:hypothetical protein